MTLNNPSCLPRRFEGKANGRVKVLTEQRDLLGDSVDVDDGPQGAADAESTVEEDGLSIVDAVENPPVAVRPEGQHVVLQGESLRQGLGPVPRPSHQIRAGVLGDVRGHQFAGVQAGEAEAEGSAPACVHTGQAKSYLDFKKLDA